MGTIIAVGIIFGAVTLFLYPGFLLIERTIAQNYMADRLREWRILTAKMTIVEYQMIKGINAMRGAMGQHKINAESLVDQFDDWRWKDLLNDADKAATSAVKEQEGRMDAIK